MARHQSELDQLIKLNPSVGASDTPLATPKKRCSVGEASQISWKLLDSIQLGFSFWTETKFEVLWHELYFGEGIACSTSFLFYFSLLHSKNYGSSY